MQNYASLQETHDPEEQGILFHTAEPTRSKWNHVEDLDSFFTRMYKYHQKHGFTCMLLQELFDLHQYYFVITLTTYMFYGIDYSVIFSTEEVTKLHLYDIVLSPYQVYQNLSSVACFLLLFASVVWALRLFNKAYNMVLFWDIKQFYNTALNIRDKDLDNMTWSEIQTKIKQVQLEQQMCIHKRELTELDIYHRILRQENYLVAMVNKKLLPPRIRLPVIGEMVYWTSSLRYNIQGLFFWSPWSPFENPWHLKEEYKRQNLRYELAQRLGRQILWLTLMNIAVAPIMILWHLLLAFFSYGELIRREPGRMGIRKWSPYAKLYLRHFNELDHELNARLTRAYRPGTKYLSSFSSPLVSVMAEHIAFVCGSIFIVLLVCTLIEENTLRIDNFIMLMTILGAALPICRSLITDESLVWCPEALLQCVIMHIHYFTPGWKGYAHTSRVRQEFQQLFQYRFVNVIESMLSPLLTPFFLWYWVYPRSLDIVDFFRNFTVTVVGVGDVCSFAQMDIKKHGNPSYQKRDTFDMLETDSQNRAEDGKIEMSLVHFATVNPDWEPPEEARNFVDEVHEISQTEGLRASLIEGLRSQSLDELELQSMFNVRASLMPSFGDMPNDTFAGAPGLSGETKFSRVSMVEGPSIQGSINMRNSMMAVHNFHERHRQRGSSFAEESTPLLTTQP